MEQVEIVNQLTKIFRNIFNDNQLTIYNEMTAGDVDGWDSLSHMLLITDVETHFEIKFKLRELNKIINVGVLIGFIETKLS